jgi:flagellar biosynthesis regulator FlaF
MKRKSKMLLLSGNCSAKKCKRRAVVASMFTRDMWIQACDEHKGLQFTIELDAEMKDIGLYIDPDRVRAE